MSCASAGGHRGVGRWAVVHWCLGGSFGPYALLGLRLPWAVCALDWSSVLSTTAGGAR